MIIFVCLNRLHYKLFLISLRHTLQTIIKFSFCWNFLIIFVIFKMSYQWLSLIFIKRSLIVNTLSTIRLPTTKFSCLLSYQSLFLHQFLIPLNKSFFFLLNRLPIVLNKFAIKFINRLFHMVYFIKIILCWLNKILFILLSYFLRLRVMFSFWINIPNWKLFKWIIIINFLWFDSFIALFILRLSHILSWLRIFS